MSSRKSKSASSVPDDSYTVSRHGRVPHHCWRVRIPSGKAIGYITVGRSGGKPGYRVSGALASNETETFAEAVAWLLAHEYSAEN